MGAPTSILPPYTSHGKLRTKQCRDRRGRLIYISERDGTYSPSTQAISRVSFRTARTWTVCRVMWGNCSPGINRPGVAMPPPPERLGMRPCRPASPPPDLPPVVPEDVCLPELCGPLLPELAPDLVNGSRFTMLGDNLRWQADLARHFTRCYATLSSLRDQKNADDALYLVSATCSARLTASLQTPLTPAALPSTCGCQVRANVQHQLLHTSVDLAGAARPGDRPRALPRPCYLPDAAATSHFGAYMIRMQYNTIANTPPSSAQAAPLFSSQRVCSFHGKHSSCAPNAQSPRSLSIALTLELGAERTGAATNQADAQHNSHFRCSAWVKAEKSHVFVFAIAIPRWLAGICNRCLKLHLARTLNVSPDGLHAMECTPCAMLPGSVHYIAAVTQQQA